MNFQNEQWTNKFQQSPIHLAACSGNSSLLEILLQVMKDVEGSPPSTIYSWGGLDGMKPLHLSVERGRQGCVDVLIRNILENDPAADSVQIKLWFDGWGRSPVHIAATESSKAIIGNLLDTPFFSAEDIDRSGKTSLSYLNEKDPAEKDKGELFLHRWGNLRAKDHNEQTALHHAIRFLSVRSFRTLLIRAQDMLDFKDSKGKTALHLAVESKQSALATALVERGANLTAKTHSAQTPLMLACQLAQKEVVLSMLQRYPDGRWSDGDKTGATALHFAIQSKGSPEIRHGILQALVKAVNKVDIKGPNGQTPLHYALAAGDIPATLLLARKADTTVEDGHGKNGLQHLAESKNINDQLAREDTAGSGPRSSPLEKVVRIMQEQVEDQEYFHRTLLHSAIREGNDNTALFLLSSGINPRVQENWVTPLMSACIRGTCPGFVEEIACGKDADLVNDKDPIFGQTALFWACEENNVDIVKILLKADSVDPNRQADFNGYTPLHVALANTHGEIVGLLLSDHRTEASWDIADEYGMRPLRFAIEKSDEKCLSILILKLGPKRLAASELSTPELEDLVDRLLGSEAGRVACDVVIDRVSRHEKGRKPRISLQKLAEADQGENIFSLLGSFPGMYNLNELDEDGWTLNDVAGRYGHSTLKEQIQKHVEFKSRNIDTHPYPRPSTFALSPRDANITLHGCNLHQACQGRIIGQYLTQWSKSNVANMFLTEAHTISRKVFNIRTQECIPPNAAHFYFEVEILRLPKTR